MPAETQVVAERQIHRKWAVWLRYTFPLVTIPARRAGSFALWSHRRVGVLRTRGAGRARLPVPPVAAKHQTHGCPIVQNKPNFGRTRFGRSPWWKRSYESH
jgi:hypothetical protein